LFEQLCIRDREGRMGQYIRENLCKYLEIEVIEQALEVEDETERVGREP
jgi:hypothetical protein